MGIDQEITSQVAAENFLEFPFDIMFLVVSFIAALIIRFPQGASENLVILFIALAVAMLCLVLGRKSRRFFLQDTSLAGARRWSLLAFINYVLSIAFLAFTLGLYRA